jgi:tRNA(Ile)-lysidine synthase
MHQAFSSALATLLHPLPPEAPVPLAVALSGGSDSMALVLLTAEWATQRNAALLTLTVDHRLRPESTAEAAQVAGWMAQRNIPHRILTPWHCHAGNNTPQAARQWRYDALAAACHEAGILHCLLAHHADDQLETVLLHTQRGKTEDGASGMSSVRCYKGIRFLRPLLHCTKTQLQSYLIAQQHAWIEDPTNRNSDYARPRARQALAEDIALQQSLQHDHREAQQNRRMREVNFANFALQHAQIFPEGRAILHWPSASYEPALWTQLLADSLTCIGEQIHRPRKADTHRLAEALATRPQGKRTLHGCLITWNPSAITLTREHAEPNARFSPRKSLAPQGVW